MLSLLKKLLRFSPNRRLRSRQGRRSPLFLEVLEERISPALHIWVVNIAGDTGTARTSGATSGDLRWCIQQAALSDETIV
jgi:hypothetical protein